MKTKRYKVDKAVALASIEGQVHQIIIPSEELVALLEAWFKSQGKPFKADVDPLWGISLEHASKEL